MSIPPPVQSPHHIYTYRDNLSCSQYPARERLWTFRTALEKTCSEQNPRLFPPQYALIIDTTGVGAYQGSVHTRGYSHQYISTCHKYYGDVKDFLLSRVLSRWQSNFFAKSTQSTSSFFHLSIFGTFLKPVSPETQATNGYFQQYQKWSRFKGNFKDRRTSIFWLMFLSTKIDSACVQMFWADLGTDAPMTRWRCRRK